MTERQRIRLLLQTFIKQICGQLKSSNFYVAKLPRWGGLHFWPGCHTNRALKGHNSQIGDWDRLHISQSQWFDSS